MLLTNRFHAPTRCIDHTRVHTGDSELLIRTSRLWSTTSIGNKCEALYQPNVTASQVGGGSFRKTIPPAFASMTICGGLPTLLLS